jgi:hypothetical protein
MSPAKLIRWSGLISLLAGVLYALAAFLHPVGEDLAAITSPKWVPAHLVYWVSVILMQLGLVGLYARQVEKAGWLGLAGFVLAFIGTGFVETILLMVSTIIPLIGAEAPTIFDQAMTPPAFLLPVFIGGFGLGYILFGVATMRAGVLPRWSGLLLIIGVSFFMISEAPLFDRMLSHVIATIGDVVFGLGLAWAGYALWSSRPLVAPGSSGMGRSKKPSAAA